MRDEIYQKLNDIEDLQDRTILKKVLNSLFIALEEYSRKRIDDLEERVFKELNYSQEKYYIFSTITKRESIDPTNEFLFPMLIKDLEEKTYDISEIIENIKEKIETKMFKVFLKCDYLTFKNITQSKKIFNGKIETTKRSYKGYFTLRKNSEYYEKIIQIYKSFIDNKIPWVTVNTAYISKFADVVLLECEEEIASDEIITSISIDYGVHNKYIEQDMVPLWNIKKVSLKSSGFPMPCEDSVNFEHIISLQKEGADHGYLVQHHSSNIEYIVRNENSLIISSPNEEAQVYDTLKLVAPVESKIEKYQYEIVSNARKSTFIGRLSLKAGNSIKTKGELARIISSFQVSEYLEFQYVKLEIESDISKAGTYDMNYFIADEIREDYGKKVLVLYFKAVDSDNYLTSDILSFIVSEIQLLYPEYKCEGRLI